MIEEYRDNPLKPIDTGNKEDNLIWKRVYNIIDLILKPEKCSCGEWMSPHTSFTPDYKHQTIERVCDVCKIKK